MRRLHPLLLSYFFDINKHWTHIHNDASHRFFVFVQSILYQHIFIDCSECEANIYLVRGLRSWLLSREYFECDRIEMERLSDRSRSRSFDLLFLRCLLLWCLFGVRLRDLDRPIILMFIAVHNLIKHFYLQFLNCKYWTHTFDLEID